MAVSNDTIMVSSLGATLFGQTREAVIGVLFTSPSPLHQREIARRATTALAPVQRELATLVALGLVLEENVGNQKSYRPNPRSPLFDELTGFATKTFGIVGRLRGVLASQQGVHVAFVFGSVAARADIATSDIDLLVIGSVPYPALAGAMQEVSRELGRDVSLKLYRPVELREKVTSGNAFLREALSKPKVFVVGSEETLDELVATGSTGEDQSAEPEAPLATPKRGRKSPRARRRTGRRS
jgi:predicted nucleotidyltransferase